MGIKLSQFEEKLTKVLKEGVEEIVSAKFLNEVGDFSVKLIRKRTKLGKGVDKTGGSSRKLDSYSDSYVVQRKRLKKQGKLAGTPKKSNLTQSGQMLDKGLDHIVDGNRVIIGMNNDDDAQKAAFVSKKRAFLNLSRAEIKQITKKIKLKAQQIFKGKF